MQLDWSADARACLRCGTQVRQHVPHKRTFFYLEQLIIRHGADEQCLKIKDIHEGVDFYMANRAHGSKFVDFLQSVVPIRYAPSAARIQTHTRGCPPLSGC